nr:MAG TPA: hypothetical protein [Inoviridae sp.]
MALWFFVCFFNCLGYFGGFKMIAYKEEKAAINNVGFMVFCLFF